MEEKGLVGRIANKWDSKYPGDEQLREAAQALLNKLEEMNIGQKSPEVARLRSALAGKE